MIIFLCLYLVLMAAVNLWFIFYKEEEQKYYLVEVNKAYQEMLENGFTDEPDLSQFTYLVSVDMMAEGSAISEAQDFYKNNGKPYVIRTADTSTFLGYIKFSYLPYNGRFQGWFIPIANTILAAIGIFILGIFWYLRHQLIRPFEQISEMPYELSKGHLTKGLKETKNRHFGRFIWGLDLLRENLEEHKRKALALEKEKKMMVLSISHDIKTPLSAIRLYARALNENLYEDETRRREIINNISEKTDEIESFVKDIITTTKEDFLHIDIHNTEFYLEDLIKRLKEYYKDKMALVKCAFVVDSFDNCLLFGDEERTLEVLENLIENALKYGDGRQIEVRFDTEEDCLLLTVMNTGNTLPANEMIHLFESFWRGSNAEGKPGSGLGLYICRQIMFGMKGDIFAEVKEPWMMVTVVLKKV